MNKDTLKKHHFWFLAGFQQRYRTGTFATNAIEQTKIVFAGNVQCLGDQTELGTLGQ